MDAFGFIILEAIATFLFVCYLATVVSLLRRKKNLPLPLQYFPDEHEFNCYQRVYMNTLENVPFFLIFLFTGGQTFPKISSVAGLVWLLGRVRYAQGYWTGDPKGRHKGWFAYGALLILLLCSAGNALDRLGVIDL